MHVSEHFAYCLVYDDTKTPGATRIFLTLTSTTIDSPDDAKARFKKGVELWLTESEAGLKALEIEGEVPTMFDMAAKGYLRDRTLLSILAGLRFDVIEATDGCGLIEPDYQPPVIEVIAADVLSAKREIVEARAGLAKAFTRLRYRLRFKMRERRWAEIGDHTYFVGNDPLGQTVIRVLRGFPLESKSPGALLAFTDEMSLLRHGWNLDEIRSLMDGINAWLEANPGHQANSQQV